MIYFEQRIDFMENILISKAIEFVKIVFENDFSGHDYFHTLRVFKMATSIASKENADIEIVQLSSLLHDVDDIKLSPETHENQDNAVSFLRANNVDDDTIKTICQIISEVSFAGNNSVVPTTLAGKCVQDADRLDAIGAIGIARAFAYGGHHNRELYNPDIKPRVNMSRVDYYNNKSTTINHFYEKLFLLTDLMNTQTAKEIATRRQVYMQEFVAEFMDEWKGIN